MKFRHVMTVSAVACIGLFAQTAAHATEVFTTSVSTGQVTARNANGSGLTLLDAGGNGQSGLGITVTNNNTIYWGDQGPVNGDGQNHGVIRSMNLDGSNVAVVVPSVGSPSGVAVDAANNKIYWANSNSSTPDNFSILSANLPNGSGRQKIVSETDSPQSLVIDTTNKALYWTNLFSGAIKTSKLDGSSVKTVTTQGFFGALGLAIDPIHGLLYWGDAATGTVDRANLDGSGKVQLVNGLSTVTGLALDLSDGKLFIADQGNNSLDSVNLDGTGLEILGTVDGIVEVAVAEGVTIPATEPGTVALFGGALAGLAFLRRRKGH